MKRKIKSPREARGHRAIKRIPRTMSAAMGKELPIRTIDHIWHAHRMRGMRDIARIGVAEWETVVADALRDLEKTRYQIHNREHFAVTRIHTLLDTVRRRTEELQDLLRELEAFSYSVSHDLRAPLRAISGFARVLEEDQAEKLDTDGRRALEKIRRNAEHMGNLIDDLLEFSRLGRREMQESEIDMEAMIRNQWDEMASGEESRQLDFRLLPLPRARGDRAMLQQVVINLLSNALKFTRGRTPAVIEVGGRVEGGHCLYYIKDNGVGFETQYASKLFEVFQRLHTQEEYEGTGVGLALVKRIVERHNGRVWAESKPNEGATFYFTLPI